VNAKDLAIYAGALEKELVLLRDGTWEKKTEVSAAEKVVMKLISTCNLDESLMMVAPKAVMKKPDERGEFDNIAMVTIEEGLTSKTAELKKLVEESDSSSAARAAATASAQAAVDAASEAKEKATADVKDAKAAAKEAAGNVNTANAAVDGHENSIKAAEKDKESKDAAAGHFKSHNLECFSVLKDKAAVPEPAAAEADADMGSAQAEEVAA